MHPIQTDYFPNRKEFFGSIFIFSLIGMVAIMLLELFVQWHLGGPEYELPKKILIPLSVAAAIPGFLFGLWYARKQRNKQFWQLTDVELVCGLSRQQAFPLNSIQKIIVGLPTGLAGKFLRNDKPGSKTSVALDALAATDRNWDTVRKIYLPTRENSLVLCFNDGSWLPLCLYALPNGAAIMDALKTRFKDRLVHNHDFSPQEIHRLRSRDINELIPK